MYNGIGLETVRGTGTNGYVQANLANVFFSKQRIAYNSEADIKRAEAEINRKPNHDLLMHAKKRQVEMKCIEFEELMESQGYAASEIEEKVNEYRDLLLSQVESGEFMPEMDVNGRTVARDSHTRMELAAQGRDRWRNALGISADYVAGSSMDNLKKANEEKKPAETKAVAGEDPSTVEKKKTIEPPKVKEEKKVKKERKKRKRGSPSSSSSSDSSDDSSSSDSDDAPARKRQKSPPRSSHRVTGDIPPPASRHRSASSSSPSPSPPPTHRRLQSVVHRVN